MKPNSCPNMPSRRVLRDVNEDARDIARRKMKTKAFLKSRDQRKRVEMRFTHLKTHHGSERMRLRGLSGARDEFHLAAIAQNLKTLALGSSDDRTNPRMRELSCVSVGGVGCLSVEADAPIGRGQAPIPKLMPSAKARRPRRRLFREHRSKAAGPASRPLRLLGPSSRKSAPDQSLPVKCQNPAHAPQQNRRSKNLIL